MHLDFIINYSKMNHAVLCAKKNLILCTCSVFPNLADLGKYQIRKFYFVVKGVFLLCTSRFTFMAAP